MELRFTTDELLLITVTLIRSINPAILKSGPEGFTVDFPPLPPGAEMSFDEKLARGLCIFLETEPNDGHYRIVLSPEEAQRIAGVLERLVEMQNWPADVKQLSRLIRSTLSDVREGN